MAFDIKRMFGKSDEADDYIEIDLNQDQQRKEKIRVRPFTLKKYDDVNEILEALREGYSIAVIDIRPLKSRDIIELKRAITKIKKTVDALEGSIAGFGDHSIIATPEFAEVFKAPKVPEKKKDDLGFY
jgi:SepF-like predicted cell division protein (DUF552 family)